MRRTLIIALIIGLSAVTFAIADSPMEDTASGDGIIAAYFRDETATLRGAGVRDIECMEQWEECRAARRRDLLYMLGLDPTPEKTDLRAVVTGRVDGDGFVLEKLHFQSRPDLYVTCSLFLPKNLKDSVPAILYLCGHSHQFERGVSYGNKVGYQHYGPWFARHGYACLMVDSLQLGEIQGIHDGTHRQGRWWWFNRGYTPAGVEVWNAIRAIDYLQLRPELDGTRIGVTGRSGGGGYSWLTSAVDDRIKVAVPVAGMTDLEGQIVDGTIERHCDCMFMLNACRWDFPAVAALIAPRPLLIGSTDRDPSYPLDGIARVHSQVRRLYDMYGHGDNLGFCVGPGEHVDSQELQLACLRWFDKYLKGIPDSPIDDRATALLTREQLKVFGELPANSINAVVDESFVPPGESPKEPATVNDWEATSARWKQALVEKCFGGWPRNPDALGVTELHTSTLGQLRVTEYEFTSQQPYRLRLTTVRPIPQKTAKGLVLIVVDETDWQTANALLAPEHRNRGASGDGLANHDTGAAHDAGCRLERWFAESQMVVGIVAPRGVGLTRWNHNEQHDIQIRRRFMLLGQTLDGMRVWDVRRAVQALQSVAGVEGLPLSIQSRGTMAGVALYASLFETGVGSLTLVDLPCTHRNGGPVFLNVSRYLELPQTLAMAVEHLRVTLIRAKAQDWQYTSAVARRLGWESERFRILESLPGSTCVPLANPNDQLVPILNWESASP